MLNQRLILAFFIVLKFALQYFAIHADYELHRDEFLHVDLGKHLAWGYQSVPPVTSWVSWVIIHLGNSVFWVKFFPALFGALTIVIVWKTVEILKGGWFALILAAIGLTFSALLRINTLYQPNSLEYLMWSLVFYLLIRFVTSEDTSWLYLAGISFAIGFLNKYNILFMALGIFPAILLTSTRSVFQNKHFYLALLTAFIIVSPNLVWQYQNGFPIIQHLSELSGLQLVNVNRSDFLREQLFFFTGSIVVILAGLLSLFLHPPFQKFRFIFYAFLFTMALYVVLRAKSYYAIGLYPVMLAFGSVYLEKLLRAGWWTYFRPVILVLPILITYFVFPFILPTLAPEKIIENPEEFERLGLLRWEDGKNHQLPQDFADMLGWQELASVVDSTMSLLEDPENTLIHCDNYGQAGAVNFYSTLHIHDAVSFNADYITWYPLDRMVIKNVILVQQANDDDPGRERERALFDQVLATGGITNKMAREYGTKVYLLKGAKQSINDILAQEIKQTLSKRSENAIVKP